MAHVEVMKAVDATIVDATLVEEKAKKNNCPGAPIKEGQNTANEWALKHLVTKGLEPSKRKCINYTTKK